jgi:hypothetical protein
MRGRSCSSLSGSRRALPGLRLSGALGPAPGSDGGGAPVPHLPAWSVRLTPGRRTTATAAAATADQRGRGPSAESPTARGGPAIRRAPEPSEGSPAMLWGTTARTFSSGQSSAETGRGVPTFSASASASRVPICTRRAVQASPAAMMSRHLGQMGFGGERDPNALAGRQAPAPKGDHPRRRSYRHDHPSRRAHIQRR